MTDYIAHSNRTRPDSPVGTTFISSSWDVGKSPQDKAKWLAKCAYRDWFDQQLAGRSHWSHIRKCKYGYNDETVTADFEPVTLRRLLEKIRSSFRSTRDCAPLEYDAAERLVAEFNLGHDPTVPLAPVIEETIARINNSIARIAAPYLGGPHDSDGAEHSVGNFHTQRCSIRDHGHEGNDPCPTTVSAAYYGSVGLGVQLYAETAKDDEGCCYFTYFTVTADHMPWRNEPAWEPFHLSGLKLASKEWLTTVGIAEEDNEESAGTNVGQARPDLGRGRGRSARGRGRETAPAMITRGRGRGGRYY